MEGFEFQLTNIYEFHGVKTPINLNYLYKEGMNWESFDKLVNDYIANEYVSGWDDSARFLNRVDPSFKRSLRIAHSKGLTILKIDSLKLAELLYQELLYDAWALVKYDVEEVINNELKTERNESI